MSVLGLDSGYTAKHGLNPREFPRAAPSGTPLGSGHISPYIPRLLLIRIQNVGERLNLTFLLNREQKLSSYSSAQAQVQACASVQEHSQAYMPHLNYCHHVPPMNDSAASGLLNLLTFH